MRITPLLLLISLSAWSKPAPVQYSVQHPRTAIKFGWDGKKLTASDRHLQIVVESGPCSKKYLEEFLESDQDAWKDQPATKPDPVVVERGGKTMQIASASRLGGHLLSLGDKVRFLKAEVETNCKSKN